MVSADQDAPFPTDAAYHDATLFVVVSDGHVQAWPEGADMGRDVVVPGFVRDICAIAGDLWIVTLDGAEGREALGRVGLWKREAGAWVGGPLFRESETDFFKSLACLTQGPHIISTSAIRVPDKILLRGPNGYGFGWGKLSILLDDAHIFVGVNIGEFGGGLVKAPLKSSGWFRQRDWKNLSKNAVRGSCGGLLNPTCAPVTGLWPDPLTPDCILATTGLAHLGLKRGTIVRVCGDEVTLAYAKPLTIPSDWQFDPDRWEEDQSSVVFYGITGDGAHAWAVGNDGIYTFTTRPVPDFAPFPKPFHFPQSGHETAIDWSHPDYILVMAKTHHSHPASAGGLVLVPR